METEQGHLWFKDAACNWYLSVMAELICLGCIQSKFDKAIFLLLSTDHLSVIFQTHMDDFTHVGKKVFQIKIMKQIEVTFKTGNTEEQIFKYNGFNILQNSTPKYMSIRIHLQNI